MATLPLGSKAMVNEYSCVCLHGDRRPQERKANLQAFKVGWRRGVSNTVDSFYIPSFGNSRMVRPAS